MPVVMAPPTTLSHSSTGVSIWVHFFGLYLYEQSWYRGIDLCHGMSSILTLAQLFFGWVGLISFSSHYFSLTH